LRGASEACASRTVAGAARYAYNHTVSQIFANIETRQCEREKGVAEPDLTASLNWSYYSLRKEFNALKAEAAPWHREVVRHCFDAGIHNAAAAFANWKSSKNGTRAGARVGLPQYKSRHRAKLSVSFTELNHQLSWLVEDRHHVRLMLPQALRQSSNPKTRARVAGLEWVHTHGSTRRLYNLIASGRARIQKLTVSYTGGRWWASFSVRILTALRHRPVKRIGGAVGVDLGISHLATLSVPVPGLTDEHGHIANPRHFERAQAAITKLDRKLARATRGEHAHARIKRARARRYAALAQSRARVLHLLTNHLVAAFDTVCIEDLTIAGMLKGRLAKQISDAAWSTLVSQLTYKTAEAGSQLVTVNRFYPSSKTCSCCGVVKATSKCGDSEAGACAPQYWTSVTGCSPVRSVEPTWTAM
jgi:putative transposase